MIYLTITSDGVGAFQQGISGSPRFIKVAGKVFRIVEEGEQLIVYKETTIDVLRNEKTNLKEARKRITEQIDNLMDIVGE
jgi:hypothetical protein